VARIQAETRPGRLPHPDRRLGAAPLCALRRDTLLGLPYQRDQEAGYPLLVRIVVLSILDRPLLCGECHTGAREGADSLRSWVRW
jgi:hypothetical protein